MRTVTLVFCLSLADYFHESLEQKKCKCVEKINSYNVFPSLFAICIFTVDSLYRLKWQFFVV